MKSQRIIKETYKSEKLPQGQSQVLTSRKNKTTATSNVYTVKETILEKKVKRSYNTEGNKKTEHIYSSNLKQGTNSGYSITQNKIPVSNREEHKVTIINKTRSTRNNTSSEGFKVRRYSKRELDKIIKIQRWWRRMLAILNGYKIRESLISQNKKNYVVKSQKIYTEKYISTNSSNRPSTQNFKNSNPKSISSLNNANVISKSYTNINNITSNMKKNLSTNVNVNTSSSSQNYIQTIDKRVIRETSPRAVPSSSTSPSVKSKYIIETKKVEVFKKPKNTENKFVKEKTSTTMNSMTNIEIKQIMRGIWGEEIYCSPVESLCCLADDNKSNISQNTIIFEEYEEEIRKLKSIIMQKDDELNNLTANLKETKNQLNISITKNMKIKKGYNQRNLDQDAHELQIISTKLGWNDVNIPSPVNEMYIEAIENRIPQRMQYIEGMQIMGKRQEESVQESITDPEAVLEIQEMNALSIISKKSKTKNICQHLQSLMILSSKKEEQIEEYSIKEKEEKNIEIIPVEKEPLIFQKIEQINYKSRPKPRKPMNQIQELDGLEIINYRRPKVDLKRKVKVKFSPENIDKICLKSTLKKPEKKKNTIQELDGLEILKKAKKPNLPQCVDELEIEREYDMLLVKPTWNSLQIQGSGLNLLALPRDMGLENQEVDEFEILGMEKPELFIESLDKLSFEKAKTLEQIQVLITMPKNKIEKRDNIRIYGRKKEQEVKIVEKIVEKKIEKKVAPNRILKGDNITLNGMPKVEKKVVPNRIYKVDKITLNGMQKVEKKVVPNRIFKVDKIALYGKKKVEKKVVPNRIFKVDKITLKGKKKVDIKKKVNEEMFQIDGLEKEDNNEIIYVDDIKLLGKEKKVVKNKIVKNDKIQFKGAVKKVIKNKIDKKDKIQLKGKEKKVFKNYVTKVDKIELLGMEKEEKEPEENIEESVVEISIIRKQKKVVPNKVKILERFKIKGIEKPKKVKEVENIESLRISKAYSTKQAIHEFNDLNIGKRLVVTLYGAPKKIEQKKKIPELKIGKKSVITLIGAPKKVEQKQEVIKEQPIVKQVVKDWNKMIRPGKSTKLLIKSAYKKVEIPQQEIEKEEIETVEKIYKNWNDEIKPIKSTKLNVKGIQKVWDDLEMEQNDQFKLIFKSKPQIKIVEKEVIKEVVKEKEKEEFEIENFALNITESGKKFRESLHIENGGFDLEGNKDMILKEGPAQKIQITKEQILIPSKILQFNLLGKPKKEVKKPEIVLKTIKENKLFIKGLEIKKVNWNDTNALSEENNFKFIHRRKKSSKEIKNVETNEKIRTVEKIVEVEKEINWNEVNKIERKGRFNLLTKKRAKILGIRRTNIISLLGSRMPVIQKEEKVEQTIIKDWTNSLHAQRNAKFALYGKPKTKKNILLVANGDKFFIQKEAEDEIIYNDDYNTRKEKQKLKDENEKKKQIIREKEIIKEKEYIPRLQREIRAQISRVRESESETSSSISEIDVLAAIRNQKMVGYASAAGTTDAALLQYRKSGEYNGYQTKVISGEVVFTAKNGIGASLGAAQYQRQIKSNATYTKRISGNNKISGIEIVNPNVKNEIYYQKMYGISGPIADGSYKIIGTKQALNEKGLTGSVSCRQMKVITKNINSPEDELINNGQSYRKQVIITSKTENVTQKGLNGSPISNEVIKDTDSKNSGNSYYVRRDSKKSGNSKIRDSPNTGNNFRTKDSPKNSNNSYVINQQINKGKVVVNSRIKTENSDSEKSPRSTQGKNKTITTTKQYQMKIKTNGDRNERVITESKKVTEVKMKKK